MQTHNEIKWSEIILFSLISYVLAWIYWVPFLIKGMEGMRAFPGPYGFANGMFAPMIAALIMRLFVSREGLKGSLGILRHWKYYIIALLAPAAYAGLLVLVVIVTGQSSFTWPGKTSLLMAIPLLMLKSLQQIPLGIGEEYGWRGYLLPRLLPMGECKATILVGLIWCFWHLPMMVMGLNYPGQDAMVSSIIFIVFVVLMSFPFTWLFLASRHSVMVVALFHIALDVFTDIFCSPACLPEGNQLFVSSAGITSSVLLLVIIVLRYTVLKHRMN
ncbi:MAG: CPBP family intramembrane metalloprotease [Deltaproteobacteria bacterium]|nr:CPBP family intramembrane metalloprotease [Deltaproteobacteria bacterium]MBN2686707.1 CPBP family intramembrane metalloprotease [Deltaproteobacteria bacterium]